jgi:hypothetical protein
MGVPAGIPWYPLYYPAVQVYIVSFSQGDIADGRQQGRLSALQSRARAHTHARTHARTHIRTSTRAHSRRRGRTRAQRVRVRAHTNTPPWKTLIDRRD